MLLLQCYSVAVLLLSRDSCGTRGAAARGEVRRLGFLSSALFPSVMADCLLTCATVNSTQEVWVCPGLSSLMRLCQTPGTERARVCVCVC